MLKEYRRVSRPVRIPLSTAKIQKVKKMAKESLKKITATAKKTAEYLRQTAELVSQVRAIAVEIDAEAADAPAADLPSIIAAGLRERLMAAEQAAAAATEAVGGKADKNEALAAVNLGITRTPSSVAFAPTGLRVDASVRPPSPTVLSAATLTAAGVMSAADKEKFDGIVASAEWPAEAMADKSPLRIIATPEKIQGIMSGGKIVWAAEDAPIIRVKNTSTTSGSLTLNGKTYRVGAGESLALPPCEIKSVSATSAIKEVKLSGKLSCNIWRLNAFEGVEDADLRDLDTSALETIEWSLEVCESLKRIETPKDYFKGRTRCDGLFIGCRALEYVDTSGWDLSNAVDMQMLFQQCGSLTELDIKNWDVRKLGNCDQIFRLCTGLRRLDLSGWHTDSIWCWRIAFHSCSALEWLDIRNWHPAEIRARDGNTVHFYYDAGLFGGCTALHTLYFPRFGECETATSLNFASLPWGTGGEESRESLIMSLVTESFDRTAAGWNPLVISLSARTKAVLTDEEKAAITAKGYTIA